MDNLIYFYCTIIIALIIINMIQFKRRKKIERLNNNVKVSYKYISNNLKQLQNNYENLNKILQDINMRINDEKINN